MRCWPATFAWDGILPLGTCLLPTAVMSMFPQHDVAEVATFLLLPIGAALVRCSVGARQIRRRCHGRLPLTRQLALGVAISLLLAFEGFAVMLAFTEDEPLSMWAAPTVMYFCYLGFVGLAFIPARDPRKSGDSSP